MYVEGIEITHRTTITKWLEEEKRGYMVVKFQNIMLSVILSAIFEKGRKIEYV